jgi:hypothetical protein
MLENKTKEQSIKAYMWTLLFLSFGAFVYSYREIMETYNTTVLAFTYQYGFLSRALIGSLYHFLDWVLPINLISYEGALYTSLVVTLLIYGVCFLLCYGTLRLCPEKYLSLLEYIWFFIMLNMITTFSSKRNLGRLDIFMILFSLLAVWCIVRKKHLWLVVPLSWAGVMVHQGYVFMYFSMILVLLIYQWLSTGEKKFLTLLALSFGGASMLFLWFQFFSHGNGEAIVDDIIREATALSKNGEYHETLIQAEILGVDLTESEWPMHVENLVELPFFLLFMLLYIVLAVNFFKKVLQQCVSRKEKVKYWLVILGAATILPDFILKVDYGRWFLAVVIYYLVVIMALLLLGDSILETTLLKAVEQRKQQSNWAFLLVLYPVLFLPFWDVHICELLKNISNPINEMFLHIW